MRQELAPQSFSYSFIVLNEPPRTKFEIAVAESIDDVLSALGNKSKQAIYRHLENRCGIQKEEIPFKIESFTQAIEQTFGSVALVIELKVLERLHSKCEGFSFAPRQGELNFVEYVYNLQNYLELEA
jgi:hypothetical protein